MAERITANDRPDDARIAPPPAGPRPHGLRAWLLPTPPQPVPLPGRPPAGSAEGPRPHPDGRTRPATPVRAVCCSGGGIRAAAFALGGLQGLSRRSGGPSWYDGVDLVTAVSGGSYTAGSFAMVNHHEPHDGFKDVPVYAPGSPEDNRLRAHTRYLIEDPRVAAIGMLSILHGLVLNLLPLLAGLFVGGTVLGWGLHASGLLRPDPSGWQPPRLAGVLTTAALLAGAGLAVFAADRLRDVYKRPNVTLTHRLRTWTLRLFVLAGAVLVLLAGMPALLHLLTVSGPHRAAPEVSWQSQVTGFAATAGTLVGLVKATLGRVRTKLQTSATASTPGPVTGLLRKAGRLVTPWLGSAVAVALLAGAFAIWTANAAYRATWRQAVAAVLALVGLAVWRLLTDINRNSVHPFYKERLCSAFAVRRTEDGTSAQPLPYDQPVRFSAYKDDKPTLVVCAAVNTDEEGVVPSGRGCAPFTYSPSWTGVSSGTMFAGEPGADATREGMRPTREYEELAGPRLVTLPAAVAVSGAAVSPVMGRMTRAPLRLLLGLANVRLGLWLPNPTDRAVPAPKDGPEKGLRARLRWQWSQPGIRALLAEMLGHTRLEGRWVYVTDGGHYENLGLVEALRRGATEIVAFDASGDPPLSWATFGEAVETARADLGVEVDLDPTTMTPPEGSDRSPALVVEGSCTYPNGVRARLWLCKLALPAKASWDVLAWAGGHPTFPHDSTGQQLYGDREFEAYRRLGETAAEEALHLMSRLPAAMPRGPVLPAPAPEPERVPEPDRVDQLRAAASAGRVGTPR